MRWITSCAITGVACASITITASSPITTPVLGSPSVVYAYALSDSLSKLTSFSSTSACDANFLSTIHSLSADAIKSPRLILKRQHRAGDDAGDRDERP